MKIAVFLRLLLVTTTGASRILLFPFDHQGHVNYFCIVGQELQSRGHVVDIIAASRSAHLPRSRGLNVLERNYSRSYDQTIFDKQASGTLRDFKAFYDELSSASIAHVTEILADKSFIKALGRNNYEIALIEGADPFRTQYLLPYKLGIRYATIHIRYDPWMARVPSLPSIEGANPFMVIDEDSNFIDRLKNTLISMLLHNILAPPSYFLGINDGLFEELVPEKPNIGFEKLFQKSEMFFIVMDQYCVDMPRVFAPHYQIVGGLGATPAAVLNAEFFQIMDASSNGVIIFSLGSGITHIPDHMFWPLMDIFSRLKQIVLIGQRNEVTEELPPNVHFRKWIPQNDLLGHTNTKLFIFHGGKSGLLEAVYHGVPVLMNPFQNEQKYNAHQAETRGYGLQIDLRAFKKVEFESKLHELLRNSTYKENINRCSRITKSLPLAKDKAAFWIEHILEHGSDHLQPHYMHMPLWKFLMFDIILFAMAIIVILGHCGICCISRCFYPKVAFDKKKME